MKKREVWESNRDSRMKPKGDHSSWCYCDLNTVSDGETCSVCGRQWKGKSYRLKRRDARAPQSEE